MSNKTAAVAERMQRFTVLLLRPDYMTDNFGQDTYMAHIEALNVHAAIRLARIEALQADTPPDNRKTLTYDRLDDYFVLFAACGYIHDINPGDR